MAIALNGVDDLALSINGCRLEDEHEREIDGSRQTVIGRRRGGGGGGGGGGEV